MVAVEPRGERVSIGLLYRAALALFCIAGFYTSFLNYVSLVELSPVRPAWWILGIGVLSAPLILSRNTWQIVLSSPVSWWSAFYFGLTLLWFIWSSQSDAALDEMTVRLLSVVFLGLMLVLFADARIQSWARLAIVACVLLAVLMNAYDALHPLAFSPFVGRAAGLYLNPNISGSAIVVGMVITFGILPGWFRAGYLALAGVGVLLTFSRGAIIAWSVALAILLWPTFSRLSKALRVFVGIAAIVVFVGVWAERDTEVAYSTQQRVSEAATLFRFTDASSDFSLGERRQAAAAAWNLFQDAPFFGHGVAATVEWDDLSSTHNIVLRHLAEYGLIGSVIFPLLLLALASRRRSGSTGRHQLMLVAVLAVWGTVSHNLLDERHFLIAVSLTAMMSATAAGSRSVTQPRNADL